MKKSTWAVVACVITMHCSFAAITVYVDQGNFSNPPYTFALDEAFTIPFSIQSGGSDALDVNETYVFRRANGAASHPFYLSDQGAFNAPETVILSGDGSIFNGISGSQSFTLTFDNFDPAINALTYYCTVHSNMVGTLNVIPEPAIAAHIAGVAVLFFGIYRRRRV